MNIIATGLDGVTLFNDRWENFALAVSFDADDGAEEIAARFDAAKQAAIEWATVMREDRNEKAARTVIPFPAPKGG